jgi:DNA-binding transcriptional regulator YhcF (GntR family)
VRSTTVRITAATLKAVREMAKQRGVPMQVIIERAVEEYRRASFLDETNKAFLALKEDQRKWREELAERETWAETLADGLGEEE